MFRFPCFTILLRALPTSHYAGIHPLPSSALLLPSAPPPPGALPVATPHHTLPRMQYELWEMAGRRGMESKRDSSVMHPSGPPVPLVPRSRWSQVKAVPRSPSPLVLAVPWSRRSPGPSWLPGPPINLIRCVCGGWGLCVVCCTSLVLDERYD